MYAAILRLVATTGMNDITCGDRHVFDCDPDVVDDPFHSDLRFHDLSMTAPIGS